jgi:hypothetical protein
MTCQLQGVAVLFHQLNVHADFTTATDSNQEPVTAVGEIEIQFVWGGSVEIRFAVLTISIAERTGVGLQILGECPPEKIVGNEEVPSCGFHLEPLGTGQLFS